MEVHHHPSIDRKGFREYLLEGIMIFMAVTLGFIAENIRETISENGKAKELAKSLYLEVYSDSIAIQQKIHLRLRKEAELMYIRDYVRDSSLTRLPARFAPAFVWAFIYTNQALFEPKDGIVSQLKNSGALRYFKSLKLQNEIGNFNVVIAKIRTRNEQEYNFVELYTRPFVLHFFDFRWYEQFNQAGKLSNIEALNQNPYPQYPSEIIDNRNFKRQEAENLASYNLLMLRATRQILYDNYIKANHQLLQVLRKEYHLENPK